MRRSAVASAERAGCADRPLTVFAALVPFLNVVGFVLGSLLLGDRAGGAT